MNERTPMTSNPGFRITGRHAFAAIALFFGVIFVSNAVMIYLAVSTFPGNVSNTAYQDGRDYNDLLEAARRQQALGWKTEATLEKLDARDPRRGAVRALVRVRYTDRDDVALTGLQIKGTLRRPSQQGTDVDLVMVPQGSGVYTAHIELPFDGLWHLKVAATKVGEQVHTFEQRLFVPESNQKGRQESTKG